MLARIRQEPALVSTAVGALLALAAVFGFALSAEQTAAVMTATAAVVALVIRSKVSPVVKPAPPANTLLGGLGASFDTDDE